MYARCIKICIIPLVFVILCTFLSLACFAEEPEEIVELYPHMRGSGNPSLSNRRQIVPALIYNMDSGEDNIVYSGTLDPSDHSLTITSFYITFDSVLYSNILNGNVTWRLRANNAVPLTNYSSVLSDAFITSESKNEVGYYYIATSNLCGIPSDQSLNTISLANQYLAENPVSFLLTYSEPVVVHLSDSEYYSALEYLGYIPNPPEPGPPSLSDYWQFIEDFFSQIFNFNLPWGITFGAVIVGIFGAPLIVKAYKKFF